MDTEDKAALTGVMVAILMILWMLASWGTHIVTCFREDAWGFLIGGAIFVPIAWIHGTGVWFGWWV